jgi:hypothetical protein
MEGGTPAVRYTELVTQVDVDDQMRTDILALGQELLGRAAEIIGAEDVETGGREEGRDE